MITQKYFVFFKSYYKSNDKIVSSFKFERADPNFEAPSCPILMPL